MSPLSHGCVKVLRNVVPCYQYGEFKEVNLRIWQIVLKADEQQMMLTKVCKTFGNKAVVTVGIKRKHLKEDI